MAPTLKFKISPREFIFSLFLILLPFSLYADYHINIPALSYVDETLCIICIVYTLYFSFKKGIKGTDLTLLILMIICSAFGFIGNFIYKLISQPMPILVDFICLAKIFVTFIVYKQVAEYDTKRRMINYLAPISKLLIWSGSICGFISIFFDIGMTGERRYGIPQYNFIFVSGSRYGYIIACCLLILMFTNISKKKLNIYKILTAFNLIMITKGVVLIILVSYLTLSLLWRNKKETKFTPANVTFLSFIILIASIFQINTYIRDLESPRMTLLKYGFVTANKYFPFGSGFATYGSDMAARNYSVLYKLYGFQNRYGLNMENKSFLNDCYLGMVFGEFGYIGAIIFAVMLAFIFIPINKITISKGIKILTLSIFIALVISSLGTAIIKSSIGVFVMCILGMVCGYDKAYKSSKPTEKEEK